jgi:hypothetical protein
MTQFYDAIPMQKFVTVSSLRRGTSLGLLGSLLTSLLAYSLTGLPAKALDPSELRLDAFNPESSEYGKCENKMPAVLDRLAEDPFNPALTQPSLWLNRDIFASRARFSSKLFENWLVCPSANSDRGRIDLVVNGQLWSLLDYFERYELLQQFGNGSDQPDQQFKSGYNLRVFSRQNPKTPLAHYTCMSPPSSMDNAPEPEANAPKASSRRCRIYIHDANNGFGIPAPL